MQVGGSAFDVEMIPALICAPEQLTYENGRLRCGSFPIDLVYKRVSKAKPVSEAS